MMYKLHAPGWWLLYALAPMMGGLLATEFRAPVSPGWHKTLQVGIVVFVYSLVWLWVRVHEGVILE